jgi:hypothetical protein
MDVSQGSIVFRVTLVWALTCKHPGLGCLVSILRDSHSSRSVQANLPRRELRVSTLLE